MTRKFKRRGNKVLILMNAKNGKPFSGDNLKEACITLLIYLQSSLNSPASEPHTASSSFGCRPSFSGLLAERFQSWFGKIDLKKSGKVFGN